MNRIPAAVDVGHFVGKKFDEIHDASDRDHQRMAEHFKIVRQLNQFHLPGDAQRRHCGIQVDT